MNKVPNLRFKEFSGEWQQHVLGDIFEFYTTNSFSRDFLDNDNGSVKNIHYGDIHMKFPTLLDIKNTQIPYVKESVDLSKISIESYCKNGDVVIADASEDYNDIGKAIELQSVGEERIIAGLHTILARDNKGIMVNGFRGYLMTSPNVRKQIKVYAAGAKVLGISKANISKVNLLIPSRMEQEKIAAFFSLIDKKIEFQTEKVEELKNYKKGLMQKIFSQELRFKDENGNKYPEWKEKKLGQICEITTGKLDANAMVENGKYRFYTCAKEFFKIDEYAFDTEALLISGNGANVGYIHYYNGKFNAYQRTYVLTNFKENILFIKFYLNQHLKRRILEGKNEGNTPYIVLGTLKDMILKLPFYEEQEKIASFFSLIDKKLELEMEKLEQLQEYKKGLLQQMFI